jgi:hypothetical protein
MPPLNPDQPQDHAVSRHGQIPRQEYSRPPTRGRTATIWFAVIVVVLTWVIVTATHIEWVRQHDGPSIHPISYAIPVVVSVLAVTGLAISRLLLVGPRKTGSGLDYPRDFGTGRAGDGDNTDGKGSSAGLNNGDLYADRIYQAGRDINIERANFLREIAATKTRARWLIGTGFVSFVVGLAVFAAGVVGFIKQVGGSTGPVSSTTSPFGPDIGGIPSGVIGWALAVAGVLLVIVGIVLHIVATSRRKSADRQFPVYR